MQWFFGASYVIYKELSRVTVGVLTRSTTLSTQSIHLLPECTLNCQMMAGGDAWLQQTSKV